MPMYVYWFGAAIVLIIVEFMSLGLTTIWFAAGALAAALCSWLGLPVPVQIAVFLVVSLILLVLTRPWAEKHLNSRLKKTNLDSIIGRQCLVTETIDNIHARGQVSLGGQIWTARSAADDVIIPDGATVRVQKISGVKLIVEEIIKEEIK